MASERKFVHKALEDGEVVEFLERQVGKAGVSSIQIQRTPVATRITMQVQKPGMVVGKRGAGINELVESLKQEFHIDNPQIEVLEVPVPSLDAKLMAEKIGRQIGLRGNIKQVLRMAVQEIMSAGALGTEIRIAGKIVGKGGKAKTLTARAGFLKKSGNLTRLVRLAKYTSYPKAGAIGVKVRILPPGVILQEKAKLDELQLSDEAQKLLAPPGQPQSQPAQETSLEQNPEEKDQKPVAEEKPKKRGRKKKEVPAEAAAGEVAAEAAGETAQQAAPAQPETNKEAKKAEAAAEAKAEAKKAEAKKAEATAEAKAEAKKAEAKETDALQEISAKEAVPENTAA